MTSFLKDDSEIDVIGIGKYSPDSDVDVAISRNLDVYVPEKKLDDFGDFKITGSIESALDKTDLVVDASSGGLGFKNKKNLYEPRNLMAIYQAFKHTEAIFHMSEKKAKLETHFAKNN